VLFLFTKKGSKSDVSNYRPISTLPNTSKMLESLLHNQICSYLNRNNLIYSRQFGFRRNYSTELCCVDFLNSICIDLDQNRYVACVFIDLSKAFDLINHNLLLNKLYLNFNFSKKARDLISSFLSQRTQRVFVNSVSSDSYNVLYGVPQGSILGPLLFLLYINDIPSCLRHSEIFLYADDSTIKLSHTDPISLFSLLNSDLFSFNEFCIRNHLSINVDKTKCMLFKPCDPNLELFLNGVKIECVTCVNFLGLMIDNKLKFGAHVNHIVSKLYSMLSIVRRNRVCLPSSSYVYIFNAL